MNHNEKNAMSRILKIAAALAVLASLGACTVVPPRVAYSGPSVGIVVGPAPYYAAPYYAAPAPYYAAPAYGGYWRRGGNRHRHWHFGRHWQLRQGQVFGAPPLAAAPALLITTCRHSAALDHCSWRK